MLNSAIVRPKITFPTMKSQGQQFIVNLRILDPATIRLMTALIVLGLLLVLPAGLTGCLPLPETASGA